jgi:hypothetical protein
VHKFSQNEHWPSELGLGTIQPIFNPYNEAFHENC